MTKDIPSIAFVESNIVFPIDFLSAHLGMTGRTNYRNSCPPQKQIIDNVLSKRLIRWPFQEL